MAQQLAHIPLSSTPTALAASRNEPSAFWDQISYVQITWVDFANNPRCRILPWSSYAKLLQKERPGIRLAKITLGYVGWQAAEGFGPTGNWLLVIDTNSLRLSPYTAGLATVYGWFQEAIPDPTTPGAQIASPLCPRYILHRALQYAREIAQVEFLVGFETEFILLTSTDPITAGNKFGWSDTISLPAGSKEALCLREIADNIVKAGVELEMYHAEAAPGQYEVITGPLTPLEAVDALVHTRDIIMNTASKYGFRATLSPRVFEDNCGSGAHAHISLKSTSNPSSTPYHALIESHFLSSLLSHLPALQALTLPLPASYLRVQDGIWSGGTWVCWGDDNKEVPVRLVDAHVPGARRFEVKCVDGLANPYLAIASIIAAGAHGIVSKTPLTIKDIGQDQAALLSPSQRQALGITTRMSLSVDEAREKFAKDEVLAEIMGREFVEAYLSVNKTLKGWTDADPDTTRRRYVEHW